MKHGRSRLPADPARRTLLRAGAAALLLAALPVRGRSREETLVIGKVSHDPKKHYGMLKPIADYVAAGMTDLGVTGSDVAIAGSREEMAELLRSGRVDWVGETLYGALLLRAQARARPVVLTWKKGVPEYRSVFITRIDGPVQALADLAGRRLALQETGSTTSFFLPLVTLYRNGLKAVQLASPADPVPPGHVGYVLAGAEVNISTWVYRGLVDAGAYSDLDFDTPEHTPPVMRRDLRLFHQTDPVPRAVEVVRADLADARRERLIALLLAAADDSEGRRVLYEYLQTRRFAPLDAQVREAMEQLGASAARFHPDFGPARP